MTRTVSKIAVALALLAAAPVAPAAPQSRPLEAERDCVIGPHIVVDVSSAVPGLLESVSVDRSDTVSAGQELARLESGVERASLELARAWSSIDSEVRIEETTRALDNRRNDRISQLYASRAVALDDKDRAETDARLAALRLRQARERRWIRELDAVKAEATLERRTVRSPIDGVVVERFRAAGEYVENQPVVRIARLDPLQVETILPMGLFGQVAPGMVAEVRTENSPDRPHRAVVSVVDRVGDPASGTFGVRLSLSNPDSAIPAGLKCSLRLLPGEREPVPGGDAPALPAVGPGPAAPVPPTPAAPALEAAAPDANVAPDHTARLVAAPPDAGPGPAAPQPADGAPAGPPAAAAEASAATPPAVPAAVAAGGATPAPAGQLAQAGAPDAEPAAGAGGDAAHCARIGPVDSAARARSLAQAIRGREALARVEREIVSEGIGFIVVTPAQADLEAAKRLSERIARSGIQDRQVMYRGEYVNRVSLGVYPSAAPAERRREQVVALGVDVQVLERTRSHERWWVRARASVGQPAVTAFADLAGDLTLASDGCGGGIQRAAAVRTAGGAAS